MAIRQLHVGYGAMTVVPSRFASTARWAMRTVARECGGCSISLEDATDWESFCAGSAARRSAWFATTSSDDRRCPRGLRAGRPLLLQWHLKHALDRLLKQAPRRRPIVAPTTSCCADALTRRSPASRSGDRSPSRRTPSAPGDSATGSPRPARWSKRSSPAAACRPTAAPTRR